MELIIHIGVHKTATTTIQRYLYDNRDTLIKKNILYPLVGCEWGKGHHNIASALNKSNFKLVHTYIKHIQEEAKMVFAKKIVISSEAFSLTKNHKKFLNIVNLFFSEVKIICVARRQDSLAESLYNQNIKSPAVRYTKGIEDFLIDFNFFERYDYLNIYNAWNRSNIKFIFMNFEKIAQPEKDFLQRSLELTVQPQKIDLTINNKSIDNRLLYYLRHANKHQLNEKDYKKLLRIFKQTKKTSGSTIVTNELRTNIFNHLNARNEQLNYLLQDDIVSHINCNSTLQYLNPQSYFSEKKYQSLLNLIKDNDLEKGIILANDIIKTNQT